MKKGKRGQSTSVNQLIPWVIGFIIIAIIGFLWYNISQAGESATDALPEAATYHASVCKTAYAPAKSVTGWCVPSKVGDRYMNCKYIKEKYDPTLGVEDNFAPGCEGYEKTFCEDLLIKEGNSFKSDVYVNDKICKDWGVESETDLVTSGEE